MRRLKTIYKCCLLFSIFLYSCKKGQVLPTQPQVNSFADIAITNAAFGTSNLQLFVDQMKVPLPDSLSYGTTEFFTLQNYVYSNQTPYRSIAYGYRQVGISNPDQNNLLVSFNSYFESGTKYSIFLTDSIYHGHLNYILLKDSLGPSDSTKAQVRFVNLSPDAPAMDVWVFPNAGTYGYKLFSNRSYPIYDNGAIVESQVFNSMDVGPYYFVATAAGTYNVLLQGGLILPGRGVVTIYARGLLSELLSGIGNNPLDVGIIEFVQ